MSQISVFGTGYSEAGMHLIPYESGMDGALVLDPASSTSRFLLVRFAADQF